MLSASFLHPLRKCWSTHAYPYALLRIPQAFRKPPRKPGTALGTVDEQCPFRKIRSYSENDLTRIIKKAVEHPGDGLLSRGARHGEGTGSFPPAAFFLKESLYFNELKIRAHPDDAVPSCCALRVPGEHQRRGMSRKDVGMPPCRECVLRRSFGAFSHCSRPFDRNG